MSQDTPRLVLAPISFGELLDKISILEIKAERIRDPAARARVVRELDALRALRDEHGLDDAVVAFADTLAQVNRHLWEVEDALRQHEREGRFDSAFIELARSVYRENDRRAALKRDINVAVNSMIFEEKLHFRPGS